MVKALADVRVLLVGAGGLGCPSALALAAAGVGTLVIADDDEVDLTNLHRQVLFEPEDVGRHKVDAVCERLAAKFPETRFVGKKTRFLPETARDLTRDVDLVVEGSDNFPTKFLVSDACALERRAVVHGAALRWHGTVLSVSAEGRPCYRCLFEDVPAGEAASCASAGVMGPVCGVIGAFMADAAVALLRGEPRGGTLVSFDGLTMNRRTHRTRARAGCPSCGEGAPPVVLDRARYMAGGAC
jgi:adenylyltransferase/sulfurtransferase